MNTKGIKFLAVLAVMVMAFAAVIVLAPADNDVVAIDVYNMEKDPTVITKDDTTSEYYISDDATVKITGISSNLTNGITFYVQNGKELELDITSTAVLASGKKITVYSVTADQQAHTTSTVYTGGEDGQKDGKIIILETVAQFAPATGQTFVYKSMMPNAVYTYTTSGKKIATDVWTYEPYAESSTIISKTQRYATISSDAPLGTPTLGKYVTVASGQSIEMSATTSVSNDFTYGVLVTDNSGGNSKYTYYATGMNAGSITMNESGDSVLVKNGSAAAKVGSSTTVTATSAKNVTMTWGTDKIVVTGSMSAGTVNASGTVEFGTGTASPFTTSAGTSTIIANGSTASGSIKSNGTLTLRNESDTNLTVTSDALTGTIEAQNMKLWKTVTSNTGSVRTIDANISGFKGLVDTSRINDNLDVKGKFASAIIGVDQTNTVISDTTVTTSLMVNGILIINEGVTLTIDKKDDVGALITVSGQFAQVINNGTIFIRTTQQATSQASSDIGLHIHGGLFTNNGKLVANSDTKVTHTTLDIDFSASDCKGLGFVNNGELSVQRNDYVNIAGEKSFTNGKNGTVILGGNVSTAVVKKNSGSFTLSNAKVDGNISVTMDKGGLFTINTIELKNGATVTATDSGTQIVISPVTGSGVAANAYTVIRGINVLDISTSYDKIFDLSGTIGMTRPAGVTSGNATIAMKGDIAVTDVVTISNGYAFSFSGATELSVTGVLTLSNEVPAATTTNLSMYVTGVVYCNNGDKFSNFTNYVAAKYELPSGTVVYSSFEAAVPAAAEAGVNTISVGNTSMYSVTVTDNVLIPTGMTIVGNKIVIDNEALVAVEKNAGFYVSNIVVKDGMLAAENAYDLDRGAVKADVKNIDSETNVATFMSLNVAIATATLEGGVIELSQDYVMTSDDLVIPKGVTVDATAVASTEFVLIDSNLVVNGMLIVDTFKFIATTDDTKSITVNGTIMDKHTNGDCFTEKWYTPVAISYNLTLVDEYGGEQVWYVLTNLDNLQAAIILADDSKVTVEGDAKLGDITISGTDAEPAEVTFKGDISAGTITLDNAIIIAEQGKTINATFADALGSITITGAYVKTAMSIYSEESGVYMSGDLRDDVKGTYGIRFDGITGMNDATIGWGYYTGVTATGPSILFNGVTDATGKKDQIRNYLDASNLKADVLIAGGLVADNGTKLIIDDVRSVVVLGLLTAAEKTTTGSPGTVEVLADKIFVGMMESDIYATGDSAVLSGKFVLSSNVVIYVAPGSLIEDKIVEDLDTITIYIENEEWFSVYAYQNTTFGLDNLVLPIVNADVYSVVDEDGSKIKCEVNSKVITQIDDDKRLSQYGNIYITLTYDIFEVKIKTDGSVKAVYIDGILMETGESKNIFIMKNQKAGTHKVTVEAASGYTSDGCVLYTEMGTILPGMAFTFTEFDCTETDGEHGEIPVVVYNIKGTQVEPEPVPPTPEEESQWTVTTILLVILVVLIAIMAVIVALRLNRS